MTPERVRRLAHDTNDSEQVDAVVSRFGRLQDTLGDRLLPEVLDPLGEPVGAFIDNLDRAEKLKLVNSADIRMSMRPLRNQMVHEYIEDAGVLSDAVQAGHAFVSDLKESSVAIICTLATHEWEDKAIISEFLRNRAQSKSDVAGQGQGDGWTTQ